MTFTSFKNARVVRSGWLEEGGRRLDCNPYMSGAREARDALERLSAPKDKLRDVTLDVFDSGRESRRWVDDRRFGVPYMGSSNINLADLSTLPLISNRQVARNPRLLLQEGWSLITRSGTIGRMAYVRSDMAGLACSEDILRVVPDRGRVLSGYLYCFLSSKFGVPLIASGTYGAIIQHIEPEHILGLPVPRFEESFEQKIHELTCQAATARAEAARLLREGVQRFLLHAGLDDLSDCPSSTAFAVTEVMQSAISRLDASYFSPYGRIPSESLGKLSLNPRALGECARVFTPGIFKRMHVQEPEWGYAYYSGSELFELSASPRGYLSRRAPGIEDYIVHKDWLLIQDAGQVGGLIGRITRTGQSVDKSVVSNHLMRVAAESRMDAAYLFTVLSSAHGYRAIVRNAFGSSIPQLDPKHIARITVPWLDLESRTHASEPVLQAWDMNDRADEVEEQAASLIEQRIDNGAS